MESIFELRLEPIAKGARDAAASLYRQLSAAIIDGRLASGSQLPPTRRATTQFGASRNTVIEVYERLIQEGLATARHGSGTYVGSVSKEMHPVLTSHPHGQTDARLNAFWLSQETTDAISYWRGADDSPVVGTRVIDIRPGMVDSRLFPFDRLRQSFTRQLRRMENRPATNRGPGGSQGNFHLRSAVAGHVAVTRAVACEPDGILVTSGAQQAFDLIARILVEPGKTRVAVEDPGYPLMRVPFAAAGAEIVPIAVDQEGMRVDLIPRDVKIICTCPSHHFPLGVPLSAQRRAALLSLARETDAIVVEDDYDGEFRYEGSPLEALRTADAVDVVFYVGTFSKSMLPSLRLGFLIPPPWALGALVTAKSGLDWHASSPLQRSVAGFIAEGHLTRHVARMRKIYGGRRAATLNAVTQILPREIRVLPSYYGMHLTLISDHHSDLEDIARNAISHGLQAHGLARYFLDTPTTDGLVIGFGTAEAADLVAAVEIIGRMLRDR